MTINGHRDPSAANDALVSGLGPNDFNSNVAAARAAKVAAEKAKKDAADKAAANAKAKAAKDADDLAACRAEIITLKAQLQEAQQLASTSKAQSTEAKSTTDVLQRDLTAKSSELAGARSEIENLKANSSSLSNQVSQLSSSNQQLQSQLEQQKSNSSTLSNRVSELSSSNVQLQSQLDRCKLERDSNWNELQQRKSELDNGDVTVRQITWGGRDLTNDGNIAWKVKERVRNGWGIPFTNDFFGCDPQPGSRKYGVVRFCRSRKVEGWEYEEKSSVP